MNSSEKIKYFIYLRIFSGNNDTNTQSRYKSKKTSRPALILLHRPYSMNSIDILNKQNVAM